MNSNKMLVTDSFERIAEKISKLERRPGTLCPLYLLGGASLFMNDIKDTLKDIDWFIPDRWLKRNEIPLIKNSFEDILSESRSDGFIFNATHNTKIISEQEHNGVTFQLHNLSPAIVFLIKLDTGRDKDIRDMELICNAIEPEEIIDAINACIRLNDHEITMNIASQALSEITCHKLLDSKNYQADIKALIQRLDLDDVDKEEIGMSFGIDINTTYKPANDQWRGTQKRSRSLTNDLNP